MNATRAACKMQPRPVNNARSLEARNAATQGFTPTGEKSRNSCAMNGLCIDTHEVNR